MALSNVNIAPAYKGTLFPKVASAPPIVGPRAVPTPTTALIQPKNFVRSLEGVISAK